MRGIERRLDRLEAVAPPRRKTPAELAAWLASLSAEQLERLERAVELWPVDQAITIETARMLAGDAIEDLRRNLLAEVARHAGDHDR